MGIDGIGSSAIIALAAVLWFIYLIPTWLRRREYLSTERNAVRLQQTVRIMAESAEIPDVVRVEANARAVAAQRAALRAQDRLAPRPAFPSVLTDGGTFRFEGSSTPSTLRAKRLRRSRAFASFVLFAATVSTGFGGFFLATTGSWVLVAASATVGIGAFGLLGQLAAVGNARRELFKATLAAPAAGQLRARALTEAEELPAAWTPVPLPKPLYLSHPVPVRPLSQLDDAKTDHGDELRRAAADSERALRTAQSASEVSRIAPPSKFAAMGIVDERDVVVTDLDDILRRRRLAG
ncbi:MAG: hypothetical protein ABIX09_01535 [Terrimesophilobacter sp.]